MFGGEDSFLPKWEDRLMATSAWYQGESLKQLLQGAALGGFATLGRIQLGRVDAWKHGEDVGGQHRQ
jgi:hypothetical protein